MQDPNMQPVLYQSAQRCGGTFCVFDLRDVRPSMLGRLVDSFFYSLPTTGTHWGVGTAGLPWFSLPLAGRVNRSNWVAPSATSDVTKWATAGTQNGPGVTQRLSWRVSRTTDGCIPFCNELLENGLASHGSEPLREHTSAQKDIQKTLM